MKLPDSMEELVYWTKRNLGKGKVMAWVNRVSCPDCGKGLMGKPKDNNGSVKIRASYYECSECGRREDKAEHEAALSANIVYTCPECGYEGEISIPFKRKKYQGVDALVFECQECGAKIPITKKLKDV